MKSIQGRGALRPAGGLAVSDPEGQRGLSQGPRADSSRTVHSSLPHASSSTPSHARPPQRTPRATREPQRPGLGRRPAALRLPRPQWARRLEALVSGNKAFLPRQARAQPQIVRKVCLEAAEGDAWSPRPWGAMSQVPTLTGRRGAE